MRKKAHFEKKESVGERIFRYWRFKKVESFIPSGSKVLDLGCGYDAYLLRMLGDKVTSGIGIDLIRSRKINLKISIFRHNLNKVFPYPENKFNLVTATASLEHLIDPEQCLSEVRRVLCPSGLLIITTPSKLARPLLNFLASIKLISRQEIADHKQYYNKKSLYKALKNTGFREISTTTFQCGLNLFAIAKK